jgi:hypothetical protein
VEESAASLAAERVILRDMRVSFVFKMVCRSSRLPSAVQRTRLADFAAKKPLGRVWCGKMKVMQ